MSASLSIQNSVNNLNKLVSDIKNGSNNYYYFIGKTLPWGTSDTPPTSISSFKEMESVYHDIVFGKLIKENNVSPLIPYVPWVYGTVYNQYDLNNNDMFKDLIYVVTPDYSVYKCIDNYGGVPSTIQPSLRLIEGVFETSDSYTWKYMYTVPLAANTLFTSSNFIPVVSNTQVTEAAVPGTIDVYRVINGGRNYQGYHEGVIQNVINPSSIQLSPDAIPIDNFYEGCSLYLKTGLGAGQISTITGYHGVSQIATVDPKFNTYLNLQLSNTVGTFTIGQSVTQVLNHVGYVYSKGYFNINDQIIQSDVFASTGINLGGYISTSNSSNMTVINMNNETMNFTIGTTPYPLINPISSGTVLTGNVSITSTSNIVTATTANFTTLTGTGSANLAVGQFIRVGSSVNNNVRRVTAINSSSSLSVNIPFNNTLTNQNFYIIPNAVEPYSEGYSKANGYISATNINGTVLNYINMSILGDTFTIGETVKEYTSLGVDMGANGIVSFVNTSVVMLSSLTGIMTIGSKITGQTSGLSATISTINSYPNITLSDVLGTFKSGQIIHAYDNISGLETGNGTPVSFTQIPSGDVEYIVSPTATITGDGVNALAYCIVNNSIGSNYEITDVIPINVGTQYTNASVSISSSQLYGSGASVTPIISPINGHGSDTVSELGGKYLGISMLFDNAINESYKFPNYGTYRRSGIIFNPAFNDTFFNITSTTRNNLSLVNIVGNFVNNEIVYQTFTGAAATVVNCNTSSGIMQISNINNSFNANSVVGNNKIIGLTSGAVANVNLFNTITFVVDSLITKTIYNANTKAAGTLSQVVNSGEIRLSNVVGTFNIGDVIYDPVVNSYANIISIYGANNTINLANTFGSKFNQCNRITLTSNNLSFKVGERVTPDISQGQGLVIDTTHELDLQYSLNFGVISTGITLTDTNTNANGIVTFANSTYIRLTGVQGTFNQGDIIQSITGNGQISTIYPVLVLSDVLEFFTTGSDYIINGEESNASGIDNIPGTILYPDLSKNTGNILYVNNMQPFSLSLTSKEIFQLVISF